MYENLPVLCYIDIYTRIYMYLEPYVSHKYIYYIYVYV